MSGRPDAQNGPHADGVRGHHRRRPGSGANGRSSDVPPDPLQSLIERAGQGDAVAWTRLWRQLLPDVRAAARSLVSEDDVQDVVQDVAVAAWQNIASFRGESHLGTWVYRITVRRCLEVLKNGQRRLDVRQALAALPQPESRGRTASRITGRSELAKRLRQCFLSLHPTDRSALYLRHLRDLPYLEVAEILGCSEETARQRCQRARDNLRRSLLQEIDETDNPWRCR